MVAEPESAPLRKLLAGEPGQVASAIVEVEVLRAVRRAVPELIAQANDVLAQITVIEPSERIRYLAARLDPPTLRSLDAIHLATALELGDRATLVTYDERLSDAARTVGLDVLAPA